MAEKLQQATGKMVRSFTSSRVASAVVLCEAGLAPRFVDVQNGDDDQDADANAWMDDVSS
jgi:hypothetical protein